MSKSEKIVLGEIVAVFVIGGLWNEEREMKKWGQPPFMIQRLAG